MGKIKPGLSIDEEIWKQFKEKFSSNASKKAEELFKEALEIEIPNILNACEINSVTIPNSSEWSFKYSEGSINLDHNVSYSCVDNGSDFADITSSYTTDLKDIIIE